MSEDEPSAGQDAWIEIKRFDDPLRSEMVRDFLRDHGIQTRMRGNAGSTSVLNRFDTILDIRLDVPAALLEQAKEALVALEAGDSAEQPFRGRVPASPDSEAYVPPRKPAAAMMLGFIVPIGAGHFYARHGAAGAILMAGVIAAFLGVMFAGHVELGVAWGIILVADVVGSYFAVKRHNAGTIPSEGKQRIVALGVVVLAFAAALIFPLH